MGEMIKWILKITIRVAFFAAGVFALVVLVNFGVSLLNVTVNQTVLYDIFALVQLWLPFNLSVILAWLFTATVMFLTYKLAVMSITWIERLIG